MPYVREPRSGIKVGSRTQLLWGVGMNRNGCIAASDPSTTGIEKVSRLSFGLVEEGI